LMAYKDEYEVARLYAQPEFLEQLRKNFEGEPGQDYQIKLNLAPPLFARQDQQGQAIKSQYGQWLFKLMPVLARLKVLRGTPLDLFAYTDERKQERVLIKAYSALIAQLAQNLKLEHLTEAQHQLEAVAHIRGFGRIKAAAMAKLPEQQLPLAQ